MGGDRISLRSSSTDEEISLLEQEFPDHFDGSVPSFLRVDDLSAKVDEEKQWEFAKSRNVGRRVSSDILEMEANERRMLNDYNQVLESYDELQSRLESLEEAKSKILSYTPGGWIELVGWLKLSDYDVPKTTTLLLIGPKGSGKSSLVNRISRVFEDDKFASERAQVSYNSSFGDGTYFLQEYMIPRGSTSFCLYDTRSFSDDSAENMKLLKRWMTKGVRHGELVTRSSDSSGLKARMKCKARRSTSCSRERRMVNFVIFVVNALSVLKSIDSDGAETRYTQTVATIFNSPFLSFKDDKPVIVVTHGDLLSLSDRARIRVHLGDMLGIHPKKQIFDIPESCEPATELTIVDMLRHTLEHADRNFSGKGWIMDKVCRLSPSSRMLLLVALVIAIIAAHACGPRFLHAHHRHAPEPSLPIDWHRIRHLWLGLDH